MSLRLPGVNSLGWLLLGLCLPLLLWQAIPELQGEIRRHNFLAAHSLLETVSIAVSALIFFVAYGARDAERSRAVVLLGCMFLATGLFDALHMLSYPGMPDIVTPNTADKMIWFWLAARISATLALMSYVFCSPATPPVSNRGRVALVIAALTSFGVLSSVVFLFESRLPPMHIPGEGLTSLKIALEWVIVGLLMITALALHRRRSILTEYDTSTLLLAILLMAAGELFFTVYVQVSSSANLLGHVYKVFAYYYLYRAIFAETVRRPFMHIAELKKTVEKERDFAKGLLDTAPAIIVVMDANGRIQHVNPFFAKLTGYRLDQVKGKDWFCHFLPASQQERARAQFHAAIHYQRAHGNINSILTRTGHERKIEWHEEVLHDADGKVTGLLCIGLDVTERLASQARLQQMSARLQTIAAQVPVGIYTLRCKPNGDPCFDYVSPRFAALFDVDADEALRDPEVIFRTVHPDDRADHDEHNRQAFASVTPFEWEGRFVIREAVRWYHLQSVPNEGQEGEQVWNGIVTDISERVLAHQALEHSERELKRLNDSLEIRVLERTAELRRANEAKNEFLSRMSHELRTPLNAILGFTQLLRVPGASALNADQSESVSEIQHAGEHLLELVNEVLDLARIESGRLELSPKPLTLLPLLESCVAQISPAARQRQIEIHVRLDDECTVLADPTRLKQVLLNLLSNAVKYNREGGIIEIDCASVGENRERVSVRDSGRGLSAEQQSRLFRAFERLESSYEGIEGTGIGLALAKRLVEGMGGEIGVDSVPGEGSTFWFELPLADCTQEIDDRHHESGVSLCATTRTFTVMYVEDNRANQRLVHKILSKESGIEPLIADSAETGIDIATTQRPDLILLDLNLPGIDGFEALRRLRGNETTQAIPVIAVTANAMKPDIERGRSAGFDDYVTKPIDMHDLLDTIRRHLPTQTRQP